MFVNDEKAYLRVRGGGVCSIGFVKLFFKSSCFIVNKALKLLGGCNA